MNPWLSKLYHIGLKSERNIIGLMSGTSLDGLDIALCGISGSGANTQVRLLHFETIAYTEDIKQQIRAVFAKKTIDFQHLCLLNPWIGNLHAGMVLDFLKSRTILPAEIDLIASHGQTVFHAPSTQHQQPGFPNATLQIGDGDHIAQRTGIITLSDFRQKHLAAGGEGAPLAVYGDYFMFSKPGENRIMLNLGGIANFTYLPASGNATEVFTTDTGPGNTLLDAFVRRFYPGLAYDADARIAKAGSVNPDLLRQLKADIFFQTPFPKTTGPERFSENFVRHAQEITHTTDLTAPDLLATLTRFSAETIAEALQQVLKPETAFHLYLSGGGSHNPLLTNYLQELLPGTVFHKTDELGISGDAKEAVLFAVLANECVSGTGISFGNRTGVPTVSMGKISLPG